MDPVNARVTRPGVSVDHEMSRTAKVVKRAVWAGLAGVGLLTLTSISVVLPVVSAVAAVPCVVAAAGTPSRVRGGVASRPGVRA
jgi:hypothetical protein